MTGTKTIAERLREAEGLCETHGLCSILLYVINGEKRCPMIESCTECKKDILRTLARQIEAEQRSKTEQNGVDVDALLKLEDTFCHWAEMAAKNNDACQKISVGTLLDTAKRIRDAVKGAEPQLPEGVIWPTYEDGELVNFGDEYVAYTGEVRTVEGVSFRSGETFVNGISRDKPMKRPEVLDADRVPIHVGDTVWNINNGKKYEVLKLPHKGSYQSVMVRGEDGTDGFDPDRLTHRKPDTQEAIDADCWVDAKDYCEKYGVKTEWPKHYGKAKCEHLLERQRKLLGGE